jgi:CRISPR/Cas system CMR-associated protein Cmr1 (group 7 of RAMP superfamily)
MRYFYILVGYSREIKRTVHLFIETKEFPSVNYCLKEAMKELKNNNIFPIEKNSLGVTYIYEFKNKEDFNNFIGEYL